MSTIAFVLTFLLMIVLIMVFVFFNSTIRRDVQREELPPLAERLRRLVDLIPPIVTWLPGKM